MKKKVLAGILTGILAFGVLAGCGDSKAEGAEAAAPAGVANTEEEADAQTEDTQTAQVESKGTITVAASATPHAEILEQAKEILAEQGWDLQVTVFDDYVLPNEVVESGEFDANYFQHIPYLEDFNATKGTHLVNAGGIHYEPFGIYPGTRKTLDELEEGHRDVLLSNLDRDDAEELRNLLAFDPDTAGGIMNTEIILLEQDITVDEAISLIRRGMEEDMEIPYYAYVVDEDDKLVGVFSLRDLMLSKPGTILRDSLHDQDVIAVRYDTSSEEVARRMSHYNFMAMPVVDYEGRLLGVATYDDILDIMQDEASADLLGMVGAGQDETVDTPWLESVQIRLPWLIVNMVTSMMSAFVVYMFEGSIAGMALLAVLMPMVANQAGNTGQQALAVMIRQLATEKFDRKRAWIAVLREGKIGIASGVIMAMLACVGVWFTSSSPELGMVMGAALMGDMLLGALAGGSIPLIFRAVGRDPAQASSIFLTAITDSAGFFIFLGLATAFLL